MLCHHINLASLARLLWLFTVYSLSFLAMPAISGFPPISFLGCFFLCFLFPASNLFSSSISVFIPLFLYMPFCFFLSLFYSFFLPPVLCLLVFLSEQAFPTLVFSLSPWFPFSHPHWNVGRNIFFFENKETK